MEIKKPLTKVKPRNYVVVYNPKEANDLTKGRVKLEDDLASIFNNIGTDN